MVPMDKADMIKMSDLLELFSGFNITCGDLLMCIIHDSYQYRGRRLRWKPRHAILLENVEEIFYKDDGTEERSGLMDRAVVGVVVLCGASSEFGNHGISQRTLQDNDSSIVAIVHNCKFYDGCSMMFKGSEGF